MVVGPRSESGVHSKPVRAAGVPRLLLIATDPIGQRQHRRMLGQSCDVEVVESAREAIELLVYDRDFSLVLCPGFLPDTSVGAFLRDLAELKLVGCPRVVVYEGSTHAREVIEAIQLGVRQYLPGACPPSELAQKVNRLLGRS